MEFELRDGTAKVDGQDAAMVSAFRWRSMRTPTGNAYAYTTIAGRRVYLHHLIMNRAPRGKGRGGVDHINGDGLDNRRANLRTATQQQNGANTRSRRGTSSLKGVSWNTKVGAWQAQIMVGYKHHVLGAYESEEDAARAYDIAAAAAFGEYARLNFPERLGEPAPERFFVRQSRPRDIPSPPTRVMPPPTVGKIRHGTDNGNAKLTEEQVRRIIAELLKVPRRTQVSIAEEFGVKQAHISRIANRRSWAYLWPPR